MGCRIKLGDLFGEYDCVVCLVIIIENARFGGLPFSTYGLVGPLESVFFGF